MSFFLSDAFAAVGNPSAAQGDGTFSLIMMGAIFVLFYFMLIRPQNKRAKEQRELLNRLKSGDEILTASGILAKVVHLDEQYIKVCIAEGVEISIQKVAVSSILPKGTLKSL